jgi:N-acetylneuraminic acid mutarotase
VLAGSGAGARPVLEVVRFDGVAWATVTELPGNGLNAPASVFLDGRIVVVGGFDGVSNVPTADVRAYDVASDGWEPLAPLPAPRGGHGIAVLDGKIHVLGGGNSRSTIADHSVYDPATDAWGERAPLPRPEGSPAVVAFGGRLWAIGGRSGRADYGDVDVWDPTTDAWKAGPAIEPRGTAGAVVYQDAIFLFGGESQELEACLDEVLRLDADASEWKAVAALPTPRNYARAVVLDDAVFVVGGSPLPGASHAAEGSTTVERFELAR